RCGGTPLYAPWAWLVWQDRYERRFPILFRNASGVSTLSALAGVLVVAAAATRRRREATSVAHRRSRWGTAAEVRKAGLFRDAGVVLCQTDDATYRTKLGPAGVAKIRVGALGRLVQPSPGCTT